MLCDLLCNLLCDFSDFFKGYAMLLDGIWSHCSSTHNSKQQYIKDCSCVVVALFPPSSLSHPLSSIVGLLVPIVVQYSRPFPSFLVRGTLIPRLKAFCLVHTIRDAPLIASVTPPAKLTCRPCNDDNCTIKTHSIASITFYLADTGDLHPH